ncbi:DUF2637 domain-containing protein [Streptomyces chrestomyceticus]|uniref:DUF2637 domain-containing protein n=1 Tax=Streptomyces chrestomyceticus TaxID=68185 RepID=UPI0019D2E20D|nr:DUF2637 domain-containing protein [Streptomyces chrestomyceticus]
MPSPNLTAPASLRGTAAIRLGIILLGATGFALSYDALRQMAVAIHIRGLLTYAFPLVIDGFIAIGVGALLILRGAPPHSRLYVWTLVGIATGTSIWANALHAIRLNQQTRHTGLHLDDVTVGALSAIAPLALAGAVHLYLVVRRHPANDCGPQENATAYRHNDGMADSRQPLPAEGDLGCQDPAPRTGAGEVAESLQVVPDTPVRPTKPRGRQPSAAMDQLLAIGRDAPRGRGGRISRRNVEAAIRAEGFSVGKDRVDQATRTLQAELDDAPVGAT